MRNWTTTIYCLCALLTCTLSLAAEAEQERPEAGDFIPNPELIALNGDKLKLQQLTHGTPTILIFYRGGWCPYCTKHLSELSQIESELKANGYQIIAISPDKPEKIKSMLTKDDYTYRIVSDSEMHAAKAFGIAFTVDDKTLEKYKNYGINLEEASGKKHHMLPIPSAYVVASDGKIRYSYVNENYKKRIPGKELLEEAISAKR